MNRMDKEKETANNQRTGKANKAPKQVHPSQKKKPVKAEERTQGGKRNRNPNPPPNLTTAQLNASSSSSSSAHCCQGH